MRTWTYSYKTSDGLRHEAEMSAPTKDDVYAALRERGIRAIRVTERIAPVVHRGFAGLRKRDWSLIAAVVLVLIAAGVFFVTRLNRPALGEADPNAPWAAMPRAIPECSEPEYQRLVSAVEVLRARYRRELSTVDIELLSNYALLENSDDVSRFRDEIAKGRQIIDETRKQAKELFAQYYAKLEKKGEAAQLSVQNLYGLFMNAVDGADEQFGCDECAIELLDANRGKWRVVHGEVEWDDPAAASQFAFFRRNAVSQPSDGVQKKF